MAVVTKQTNDDESREPSPPTELLCTLLEQPMIPAAAALTAGVTEIVAGVRVTALHSAAPSEFRACCREIFVREAAAGEQQVVKTEDTARGGR